MKTCLILLTTLALSFNALAQTSTYTASQAGIKSDLEYTTIVLNDNNTITKVNGAFTHADIGKLIAIKKGHHNGVDGGSVEVIPFTMPGRLVTATAIITEVSEEGTATIEVKNGDGTTHGTILNRPGTKEAYFYTNNYSKVQAAMDYCYSNYISTLTFDLDGIIGVNPFYKDSYFDNPLFNFNTSKNTLVFRSDLGNLTLKNENNSRLKLCVETSDIADIFHMFSSTIGDGDITVDIPCVPGDEMITAFTINSGFLMSHNYYSLNSGNSVRSITIKNQNYDRETDNNNHDAFWVGAYFSSNGGVNSDDFNSIQYQVHNFENSFFRVKHCGVTVFSNYGPTNVENFDNVEILKIDHYNNENGRSDMEESDDALENGLINPGLWHFNLSDFSFDGEYLSTISDSIDFSFYDYFGYEESSYSSHVRYIIDGNVYSRDTQWPGNSAHQIKLNLESNEGLEHAETGKLVVFYKRIFFGHPHYSHANISYHLNEVTSRNGLWRYQGGAHAAIGQTLYTKIENSNISDTNGGFYYLKPIDDGTTLEIKNSNIGVFRITVSSIQLENTSLTGYEVHTNELNLIGSSNELAVGNGTVRDMETFTMQGGKYGAQLDFTNKDSTRAVIITLNNVEFLNSPEMPNGTIPPGHLPFLKKGELHINNAISSNLVSLKVPYDCYTSDSNIYFNNVNLSGESQTYDSWFREGFNDLDLEFDGFVFNNFDYKHLARPRFDNNHKYNGMFPVSTTSNDRRALYRTRIFDSGFSMTRYDFNILELNTQLSNSFYITNETASVVNATFDHRVGHLNTFSQKSHLANNAYVSGEITVEIGPDGVLDPYYTKNSTYETKRSNTTQTNLVVKSVDREPGEIITFQFDPKNARLIEMASTINDHYTDENFPTRLGVQNEILYSSTEPGKYFKHVIDIENIDNMEITIDSENISVEDDNTYLNTGIYFSILQELSDGTDWDTFEFELVTESNERVLFTTSDKIGLVNAHPDYLKNWWDFKAEYNNEIVECYIENRTGEVVFNGLMPFTLKAENNLKVISGHRINSHTWEVHYDNSQERDVLVNFYYSTNGANWTNSWDINEPMNNWHGVTLSPDGSIEKLVLNDNGLSGKLPGSLSGLNNLKHLVLSNNNLSGTIPDDIGDLSKLEYLYIDNNNLTGEIPVSLANLSSLIYLNGSSNNFFGCFPTELNALCEGVNVDFSNNPMLPGNGDFAAFCNSEEGSCDVLSSNDVTDITDNNKLKVYPNPNYGNFFVKTDKVYSKVRVEIYDLLGRVVFARNYTDTDEVNININQKTAVYLVKVILPHAELTKKIIIQKSRRNLYSTNNMNSINF